LNYTYLPEIQHFDAESVSSADLVIYYSMHPSFAANIFSDGKMIGWLSMQDFIHNHCAYQPDLLRREWLSSYTDYITDHKKITAFWNRCPEVRSVAVGSPEKITGQFIKAGKHRYSFETRKKLDALRLLKYYEPELKQFFHFRRLKKIGIVVPDGYESYVPDCFSVCTLNETADFDLTADCFLMEDFRCFYPDLIPVDEILSCALLLEISKNTALMNHMFFIDEPEIDYTALYPDEAEMLSCVKNLSRALRNTDYIQKAYADYPKDRKYLERLGKDVYHSVIISNNGVYRYILTAKLKGEFDHYRLTPSNQNHPNHIYCYGPCICYSIFTSSHSTIEEYLQQKLNEKNIPFDVKNCGIPNGVNLLNDLLLFIYSEHASTAYHIFINRFGNLIRSFLQEIRANYSTLTSAFLNQHYCFFNENVHLTPKGTKLTAEKIMNTISFNPDTVLFYSLHLRRIQPDPDYYLTEHHIEQYQEFLRHITADQHGITGFLHINANPMTNSHARMIDAAAAQCDTLYIFVVEDRDDALPFYDRFQMVMTYCQKYKHVTVLSGSYFIGSRYTMTAYFNKQYDMEFMPETEIRNFDRLIMPILNPDIIFMFSEPDSVPEKQLFDAYKNYMTEKGKLLKGIPRQVFNGIPVSSSEVRKLLKHREFNTIRAMVPPHVFRYLQQLSPEEIETC